MDVKKTLEDKKTAKAAFVARQLFFVGVAALVARGQLPFGAAPFGFAALCAVSGADVVGVTVGTAIGLIGGGPPWVTLGAYAITLLMRAVFSLTEGRETSLFGEHLSLRIVSAATGAFALGLYRLLTGGFLYYYLWGAIISILTASAATFLWYSLTDKEIASRTEDRYGLWRAAAFVAFASATVWGLRGVSFFGISLSAFVCALITLFATRRAGIGLGAVLGAVSGLCVSVTYAPLFAFGAVTFGLLYAVSPLIAVVSSFIVGMAWGVYIDGTFAVTSLLPALMASGFLFFAIDKLYPIDGKKLVSDSASDEAYSIRPTDIALLRLDDSARRVKLLCEGFSSLSRMLSNSNDAEDSPLTGELFAEVGEIGGETHMNDYVGYMSEILRTNAPALDYGTVADYLAGVMTGSNADVDVGLSENITAELEKKFPRASLRAVAFGGDGGKITLLCDSEELLRRRADELRKTVSAVCAYPVCCREVDDFEGQPYLTFYRRPILDVTFSGRKRNASDEEEFCGDSFGVIWQKGEGKVFSFISDGMGSGKEAAVTSGLCALFLQKLLPVNVGAGAPVDVTLNMLNGFLRSRNTCTAVECASTIDLCKLDLVDCRANFYKCGAAPTYIFRDGSLFKLRSRTVPIGIVRNVDVGRIDMELCPGDVIVMVSDGVTQGREECPELFEHLRTRLLTHSAEQLADSVIDFAERQGSTDDVSVVVIKVEDTVGKR